MLNKVLDPMKKPAMILDLITSRQEAISENLANIHTPGYQRKDVNFSQYMAGKNNSLETKLSEKLGPSPVSSTTGGEVNAADELMAMQETQIYYTIATKQMTSTIQLLKQVTQSGR